MLNKPRIDRKHDETDHRAVPLEDAEADLRDWDKPRGDGPDLGGDSRFHRRDVEDVGERGRHVPRAGQDRRLPPGRWEIARRARPDVTITRTSLEPC